MGQVEDGVLIEVKIKREDGLSISRKILTPEDSELEIEGDEMNDAEKDLEWEVHKKSLNNNCHD